MICFEAVVGPVVEDVSPELKGWVNDIQNVDVKQV